MCPTSEPPRQTLGGPEGLENAVVDTPIYDRVLLRSLRRWTGLEANELRLDERDDGNGIFYNSPT